MPLYQRKNSNQLRIRIEEEDAVMEEYIDREETMVSSDQGSVIESYEW